MHSARFVDPPAEVYATLLEEQTYLCSPRTMYRVLAEADEVRERRDQVRHPAYVKPELVASAPNQVWSWGKPLSDMTLSKLIKELGIAAVPHGFRSSFRDWAAEQLSHEYAS